MATAGPEVYKQANHIVCESEKDRKFLLALIENRGLPLYDVSFDPRGHSGFEERLRALRIVPSIRGVVVVTDSDADANAAFINVTRQIRDAGGFAVPGAPLEVATNGSGQRIAVLLIPWMDTLGNLETLLIEAIDPRPSPVTECVEVYMRCSGSDRWALNKRSKAYMQTLIAGYCEYDPCSSVQHIWGERRAGYIPIQIGHPRFNQIAEFLRTFVPQEP